MFFHPDEIECVIHNRALAFFKPPKPSKLARNGKRYVVIKNVNRFKCSVFLVCHGDSLRSIICQIQVALRNSDTGLFDEAPDVSVSD